MIRTVFAGTGRSLPERCVTNEELAKTVNTSDEWIRSRTGIGQRYLLSEGEATSDLAAAAALQALESAGAAVGEVDLLVVATVTPDMPMPSAAVLTAHKIGARCPAFDLAAACAGFSYGITIIDGLVRSGDYKTVLFIGSDGLSRFLDWNDRGTCVLFGDGAGAVVLRAHDSDAAAAQRRGFIASVIHADGSYANDLAIAGGGSAMPPTADTIADNKHVLTMNGRVIFTNAVKNMSDACDEVLAKADMTPADIDLVIPHQANIRIIEAMQKRMSLSDDRLFTNVERYGNTSSASIPIALDEAAREGRIASGDVVLMCGLGAGLTWGASVVRW